MSGLQSLTLRHCFPVAILGVLNDLLAAEKMTKHVNTIEDRFHLLVTRGELAQVAVVVTTHFHVEDLGLSNLTVRDEYISKQIENVLADSIQLSFDHTSVLVDELDVTAALIRLTVLNGAHGTPSCASATY